MTRPEFNQLSKPLRDVFIAKMLHAVNNDDTYFLMADSIVHNAELDGIFNDVRFGSEVNPENENNAKLLGNISISETGFAAIIK